MNSNDNYSGITTKIDKLLDILITKKKLDVKTIAKELNERDDTIIEWSKTLEKEGLIEVEYVLTRPYLKLAKGAEQKILSSRKKKIDSVAQDLLFKAESAANQAVIASEQLNQLEDLVKKLDLIYNTDNSKVEAVEERLEKIKKKSENYQKQVFEILSQLYNRAEDVYSNIENHAQDINNLLQKIDKDLNEQKINAMKTELSVLIEEAKYIKESTEQLSNDLEKYMEIKEVVIKHQEELNKVKQFFDNEKFNNLEKILIESSKIIENYYLIRNELKKYEQFLNISVAEVDKKIATLQTLSNELLDAYNKASVILNIDQEKFSISNINELNQKVSILKQEIENMKQLADEVLTWISSENLESVLVGLDNAVKEKEKYTEKLKEYLLHLTEIKPEISRLMDEIKLYKIELINDIRDASSEVTDLKVDMEEFKKNLVEWKKKEHEYVELKKKIVELSNLRDDMLKTVEKINKEISILSIQFSSLKQATRDVEEFEEQQKEIDQVIGKDIELKKEVIENKVEAALASNVTKVNQMSESYLKKRQIIEEMLRKIWETEYGASAVQNMESKKK
ncbi:MAG: hypothetical protein N3E37_05275 [Candidatus Micrarchaeota archaeon]|nr:hypothetical protein [Candidatus Micrarchaeota archaeon]